MPASTGYGKRAIHHNFHELYQSNKTGPRKKNPRKRDQIIAIALAMARRAAQKRGNHAAVRKLTKSLQTEPILVILV